MLITDAAKKCGLTLGELLAKLDAGELTASCLFSKHAARAIWTAELADGERVSLNFGAIGAKEGKTFVCVSPARIAFPSPNRFVLLDQHARDDDFAALTSDQDVIHPGQFIAVPPTPGAWLHPDGREIIRATGKWVELSHNGHRPHGAAPLKRTDLFLQPTEIAKLVPDGGESHAPPRHERELMKCIGSLAKLLAEHAPTTSRFAAKRVPYNATKIAEAVARESGLNSKTVAGWLGLARRTLDEEGTDE